MSQPSDTVDQTGPGQVEEHPPESEESLWLLTFSPTIWALHLALSYLTATIWCAKVAGPDGALGGVRLAVAGYTAVALAGIAVVFFVGWKRHRRGDSLLPHEDDTPEDRHSFLGLATVLLSGLSGVATIYTAIVAFFVETCR